MLLLLLLCAAGAVCCPAGCQCGSVAEFVASMPCAQLQPTVEPSSGMAVVCAPLCNWNTVVAPLQTVPPTLPNNTELLYLPHLPLSQFPNMSFADPSYASLRFLFLTWCNVLSVSAETFTGLSSLEMLDMNSCQQLETLSIDAFAPLSQLQHLYLGATFLFQFGAGAFGGLSNCKSLYFGQNQILNQLPSNSFLGLSALQSLDLSFSFLGVLTSAAWSNDLTQLISLDLQDCYLARLDNYTFSNLPQLQELVLNANRISWVDDAFHGLSALQTILMADNQITYINPLAFGTLTSLVTLSLLVNHLTYIAPNTFINNTMLGYLSLSSNRLSLLPPLSLAIPNGNLRILMLDNNELEDLPVGFMQGSMDGTASSLGGTTTWEIGLQTELEFLTSNQNLDLANPLVTIANNKFTRYPVASFNLLPESTQIVLTESSNNIVVLDSCCDVLVTIGYGSNFVYFNNTMFCKLGNETVNVDTLLEEHPDYLVCPCSSLHNPPVFTGANLTECISASYWRMINGTCVYASECPPRYRSRPAKMDPFSTCRIETSSATTTIVALYETFCQECGIYGCWSCPGQVTTCAACGDSLYLLGQTCVGSCPPGYLSNGTGPIGRSCIPCDSSSCKNCTSQTNQCVECNTLAFQLLNGVCIPCSDPRCVNCQKSALVCRACAEPSFLSPDGTCVDQCPLSFVVVNGVCVPKVVASEDTSTRLSSRAIVGIVCGSVALSVMIVLFVRFLMKKKFYVVETELRDRLVTSEEEVMMLKKAWEIFPDELVMGNALGKGAFGEVWRAQWGDSAVAVKTLRCELMWLDDSITAEFEAEVDFMRTLRHKNIVRFLGAGQLPDHTPFLVTELMQKGSLREVLNSETSSWPRRLRFARDAAAGMDYLHQRSVVHRDLKSANLLVSSTYVTKVADFGTTRIVGAMHHVAPRRNTRSTRSTPLSSPADSGVLTRGVGSPLWMSPEMVLGRDYGPPTDVYSYAIILWEIAMGNGSLPWDELSSNFLVNRLAEVLAAGQRPPLPPNCPPDYALLMQACWAGDPAARPTFRAIAEDPVFASREE
eukprot:m.87680 g.87680  ORF g.87680 m.87680 type:complete len:1055 (-) comp18030_c0_seq5:27-3191(-)